MRTTRLLILLLLASSVFASPVITSVTPSSGPVLGGTRVIIRGTGFSFNCVICSPPFADPQVFFGTTEALDVTFIDANTLEAITPPHLAETVSVTVNQLDGSNPNHHTLNNAFTYTGESLEAFEPVLFPIFMPAVRGQFDSLFETTARVASRGEPLDLYGVDSSCYTFSPILLPSNPFRIGASENVLLTGCSQSVGRFFYVPEGRGEDLVANLRVSDNSKQAESHGVEIPVVRFDEFTANKIVLLGVPVDPKFRNTLRIYGLPEAEGVVQVSVNGVTHQVQLRPSGSLFEPAYGTFTDFPTLDDLPAGQNTITVAVGRSLGTGLVFPSSRFWAFISVTNNDTQHITTITPN